MDYKKLKHHALFWYNNLFKEELTYYASSLSFYTIFTIIPLLMIILTLLTNMPGFNDQLDALKHFIFENLMPANSVAVADYVNDFLKNSVKLGVVGLLSIIVTSMLFFQNYEYIISKIFHSPRRGIWQSITTYWTLITLTPIALVVSLYYSAKFSILAHDYDFDWLSLGDILPFFILWALFFLIFKISANTEINSKAALITSFIVSLVWSIAKTLFMYYVYYNLTYATVYGSFSVVLFFFFWIYVSWIIFVYGLQVCYLINSSYIYKKCAYPECNEKELPNISQETQQQKHS